MLNDIDVEDRQLRSWIEVKTSSSRLGQLVFTSSLIFVCLGIGLAPSQAQSPANPSANIRAHSFYQQGLTLLRQNQLDDGIAVLKHGLQYDPRNTLILDAIGAAYSLQSNSVDAERYFSRALAIDPTFTPARKNLGITYYSAGKYEQAEAEFERLRDGSNDSRPIACLFLGMLAEKRHQYSRSVLLLRQSGELMGHYPESLISFAKSLYELHQEQEAKRALLQLENVPEVTPSEYFDAGVLYSQLGDNQRALSALDRAEQSRIPVEGIQYERAEVLAELGLQQQSLNVLADIGSNRPDPDALNRLAHVAEEHHQYELAIQSLRLAAKLDPSNEDNYLQFSTICSDAGKYADALQAVDIGLQHIPLSYRLLVQRAAVLDNLARTAEAEQVLQRAIELRKDNSEALLSLGIVETHEKKLNAAASTLRSAIKKFPDNFYMRYWLGYVLVQADENATANPSIEAEAEQTFSAAIRLKPSFADSYYQLATLYMHKDKKLAEQTLTACLRVDPNYASAQYVLAQLYLKTGRRAEGYKLYAQFKKQQDAAKPNRPDTQNTEFVQR
jgi:tetratricopeptide (TPR) repeat protein